MKKFVSIFLCCAILTILPSSCRKTVAPQTTPTPTPSPVLSPSPSPTPTASPEREPVSSLPPEVSDTPAPIESSQPEKTPVPAPVESAPPEPSMPEASEEPPVEKTTIGTGSAYDQFIVKQMISLAKSSEQYKKSQQDLAKYKIELDPSAENGALVLSFKMSAVEFSDEIDEDYKKAIKEKAEKQIDGLKSSISTLTKQMNFFGIKDPQIYCKFYDKYDTLFMEKEIS